MSTKGSRLTRSLDFYRIGDLDEVEFVHTKGAVILKNRQQEAKVNETFSTPIKVIKRRQRRPKPDPASPITVGASA
jgi:hypothetical protein